jgi:hypothetical protein
MMFTVDWNHSSALTTRKLPEFSSTLARNAYEYLMNVCEPGGIPNPRTLCTEGYKEAADYVAEEMRKIGLEPLGDDFEGNYFQTIKNSLHTTWCPPGIQNVIGMVRGSTYPDQYVVVLSTLSGNYNMNPQTYKTRGNDNFSFVFDSGMSVAASLAMAREMMERSPPLRSTVFLFSGTGQGESWQIVGERERGQLNGPYESFRRTKWFQDMCEGIVSGAVECQSIFMKGLTYWIKHPTVERDQIEIIFYPERLGSPYGFDENVLMLLGGEQILYGKGNLTLNNFIDEVWSKNSTVQLLKAPLASIEGVDLSYNCRSNYFTEPCGNGVYCKGLKMVWFSQIALQMMSVRVDNVRELYHNLRIKAKVVVQSNDTFDPTSPVYFTIDNLNNTYWPHFENTVTALYDAVRNTANKRENIDLKFDEYRNLTIDENDFEHFFQNLDAMYNMSHNLPSSLGFLFANEIPNSIRRSAEIVLQGVRNGTVDLQEKSVQEMLRQVGQLAAGLFTSMDFFNPYYPDGEKYLDQRVGPDIQTQPEPEPEPAMEKSNGMPNGFVALIVVVVVLAFVSVMYFVKRPRKKIDLISAYIVNEEVTNEPITASVLGVEPLPQNSFAESGFRIGMNYDPTSVDQSRLTSITSMPSPCAEDQDESIVGSMIEASKMNDKASESSSQIRSVTITPATAIQVEFKDQVSSNRRSHSLRAAHTFGLPATELQKLTPNERCKSKRETEQDLSVDGTSAASVLQPTFSPIHEETDDSFVDPELQGRPQHVTSDIVTIDNQQLDVLEDSSDSDSQSNETRLRFYSI